MKRTIAVIAVLCLFFGILADTVVVQAASSTNKPPLTLQILGKKIDTAKGVPVLKNNIYYLPLRTVGEALGYKVSWYAGIKTMELRKDKHFVKITLNYNYSVINGKNVKIDAVPVMINEKAYVPLSFLQKNFDYSTTYDKAKNQVVISTKSAAAKPANDTTNSSPTTKGVYVLGKKISSTDFSVEKNGKVFIPCRSTGEGLGYKVFWNVGTKVMELKKDNQVVRVTVGNVNALYNGKAVKLDAAPIMYNSKVYVPLSFLQKQFGYDTAYDKAKNITQIKVKKPVETVKEEPKKPEFDYKTVNIEDIAYDAHASFPQLNIIADGPFKYKSFSMVNPHRLVIDIENALMDTDFDSKEIGKAGILRVRIGQFSLERKVVRVVIDLEDPKTCKLVQSSDQKSVALIYANILEPVTALKEGIREVYLIKGSETIDSTAFKLENPERLVIDVQQAVLAQGEQLWPAATPYVKNVRSGQVDVGTARIVMDLEPGTYYDVRNDGKTTRVYLSSLPFSFVQYEKYYDSAYIGLNPGKDIDYQAVVDNEKKILKVLIPEDLDIELKKYEINDNVVEYIEVTKEKHGGQLYTTAAFKMKNLVHYELLSPEKTKMVQLKFQYMPKRPQDLTVVIDAGHGGKDPGAMAKDGTTEKSLNLDVAKRLEKIMKDLGFKTIMTRTDDSYVDLASRTTLANTQYANFFMSIHFNAFNQRTQGIETLYYPNTVSEEYNFSNRSVAQIFHSELLQALKRPSRGITPRPNLYVLNKTKMPAILAELGFMTNPEELAQMKKAQYRDMAARALAVSIVKYFEEIQNMNLDIDYSAVYAAMPMNAAVSVNTDTAAAGEVQDSTEVLAEEQGEIAADEEPGTGQDAVQTNGQ